MKEPLEDKQSPLNSFFSLIGLHEKKLINIGFSNIQDYLDEQGRFKLFSELDDDLKIAIEFVELDNDGRPVSLLLKDKSEALFILLEYYRMLSFMNGYQPRTLPTLH